jgi:hypothetical protein
MMSVASPDSKLRAPARSRVGRVAVRSLDLGGAEAIGSTIRTGGLLFTWNPDERRAVVVLGGRSLGSMLLTGMLVAVRRRALATSVTVSSGANWPVAGEADEIRAGTVCRVVRSLAYPPLCGS